MLTITTTPYTEAAAERIARAGANKMEAQGYTWRRVGLSGDTFKITKPADAETGESLGEYDVTISDGGRGELSFCSCPFSGHGFNNHTCKHGVFIKDAVQAEDEQVAYLADEFSEFDNFGRHDLVMGKF